MAKRGWGMSRGQKLTVLKCQRHLKARLREMREGARDKFATFMKGKPQPQPQSIDNGI